MAKFKNKTGIVLIPQNVGYVISFVQVEKKLRYKKLCYSKCNPSTMKF